MSQNKAKKASRLIGAGLCLITLLAVAYFIAVPARNFYNSDYADTLTWAKASVDANALFSKDFTYACLLPFGGQLLMIPFVWIFGYSYAAHACGILLFFLLLATALVCLFKALGANPFWAGACLFCMIGPLCSSEKLREVYFGHILYYSLGGLFLVVGLALCLSLCKDEGKKFPWRYVAFGAWCVLCSTDGLTSLTLFILPLCAALAFERLCDKEVKFFSEENFVRARPLFCAVICSIGGLGLGALLRNGFSAPYQEAFSTFSSENEWAGNLALFLPSYLSLFTGPVEMYQPFTAFAGIAAAVRLLFALLTLAAPIVALFLFKKLNRGERLVVISHFVVSATMLFAFVFGLLSNAAWRLSPMIFTSLLVTVCLVHRLSVLPFFKRFGLIVLVLCVLIAGLGYFELLKLKPNDYDTGSSADLAQFLEDRGCTYGYSTFWNANAITVLSGEKVKCRNVEIDETTGYLSADYYQSEHSWYNGQATNEQYFLLLSDIEYATLDRTQLHGAVTAENYHGYVLIRLQNDLFPLH